MHTYIRQLITKHELANHLRVTPRTIEQYCNRGRIPSIKLSRRCIRFDLSEVELALKK